MIEERDGLPVVGFADATALAAWLIDQPADSKGVWLKLAKKGVAGGVRRAEAVDAALCHGWIDGQNAAYDADYSLIRYTPRRARSRWSENNRIRAEQLISEGRVTTDGLRQIEAARADGRWAAAYAPASRATVPDDLQAALAAQPEAAAFFARLSGANRYAILHRIAAVKRAETRVRTIAKFVVMLARGETIYPQK